MADNEQNTAAQTPAAPGEKARVVQTKSPIRQERWKPIAKKPPKEALKKQPIYIPGEDQFEEETPAGEAPMEDFEQKVEAKPEEGLPPRQQQDQQQDQQQAQQQAMPTMPSFPSTPRAAQFSGTKSAGKDMGKEETPTDKGAFRIPKIPEGVKSVAKDVGSNAGIAFKKTSSRVASAASRGIGSGIGKAGNLAAKAGNFGINAASNFSSQFARRPFIGGMPKKYLLLLLLFMAFMLFFLTGAAPQPGPLPTGSGCPDTSTNISTCRYLNPSIGLFDTAISPTDINAYINKYSPTFIGAGKGDLVEFTKRVNYIVTNSQQAGLNPAIFLGYWKSESNFSTVGTRDMGCAGNGFYEEVDCALAINLFSDPVKNPIANCAKSKSATSVACTTLKGIRSTLDLAHPINYPIAKVDDFAEAYGPYDDLVGGVPTNCTHTYNILINVAEELNMCKATGVPITPPGTGAPSVASMAEQLAKLLVYSKNPDGTPAMAGCDPNGFFGPSYHCWPLNLMACYDQANDPDYVQCTEFVWGVFNQAGYGNQIDNVRRGNASDWPNRASTDSRFQVFYDFSQLQIADIISLGEGGVSGTNTVNSHVMVVISRESNVIRVGQASTSQAIESFQISDTPVSSQCNISDQAGHLLIFPMGDCPGPSGARSALKGIIRLIDYSTTSGPKCSL